MPAPSIMSQSRLRSIDPRTWEIIEELEPATTDDVAAAVSAARDASRRWAALPLSERVATLRLVLQRVVDQSEELAELVRREHGKCKTEAFFSEVLGAADVLKTHLAVDKKWLKPDKVPIDPLAYPGKRARVEHLPRGVVALITPWNYPLAIPMRTLVPALLAGNAVVFKPSEHTPLVGRAIARLFEGLLPAGVLQTLLGGAGVGAALCSSPGIDAIVFTGSVRTGKAVARAAAENLVPVSLELGGKDAAIVLSDADLDRAAKGIAWAAFHNTGQNCAAVERVYVEEVVYDAFLQKLLTATAELRTGGSDESAEVGPMCNAMQFGVVEEQVAEAVGRGATVLAGGKATGQGWGFEPTILADAPDDCRIWTEETFGPLLPVRKVHSAFEAVDLVNSSPYGLSASVWGKEVGRAELVARRCEVGMAYVNNHAFSGSIATAPWVGTKDSGYGVTGSPLAMKFLTRPQLVLVDKAKAHELWWFPLNTTAAAISRTALKATVARAGAALKLTLELLGLLGKRWKET
jgi:acyl-CoA reductase-like NAD-dependent aldehyde dehydrogenase